MAIILLLIFFVSVFLITGIHRSFNLYQTVLESVLIFSALLVFITEFASLFDAISAKLFILIWGFLSACLISYLILKKKDLIFFIEVLKEKIFKKIVNLNKFQKSAILVITIILSLLLFQGIVYPPNNYDSMTYHMARIVSWISHQSVAHYPTHIFRQLYQPPFSEFVIMHFNLLNGGDYFSNSVQFFFFLFSLVAVLSIIDLFGLGLQYKIIGLLLAATIPEALLQSSNTKNDVVVSFFILTAVYFSVKAVQKAKIQYFLFMGLSVGLGILTKGTAYIFLAPVLLIFGVSVLVRMIRTRNSNYFLFSIVAIGIVLSINAGHFSRNYHLTGSILGVDKFDSKELANQSMSPMLFVSSIIKNSGIQIGPYPLNKLFDQTAHKLHALLGVPINNPATNYFNLRYSGSPNIPVHEDKASNPFHFYLGILSSVLLCLNFGKIKTGSAHAILYLGMLIMQICLFCFFLKWQPWHIRLHTPLFMLSVPLICYAASLKDVYLDALTKCLYLLLFYAFCIVLFNRSRPFITIPTSFRGTQNTRNISISDSRFMKYFANTPNIYQEYYEVVDCLGRYHFRNVGLLLGRDDMEYPLFSRFYGEGINPVHIEVSNISKNTSTYSVRIDCIVSTTINKKSILYHGRVFKNLNLKNKEIWLYK